MTPHALVVSDEQHRAADPLDSSTGHLRPTARYSSIISIIYISEGFRGPQIYPQVGYSFLAVRGAGYRIGVVLDAICGAANSHAFEAFGDRPLEVAATLPIPLARPGFSVWCHPLLRSPAEIPLMVSWIPRNTCSLTPLARCCFKSSIWMWFSGSRYGNLLRIERSSNGLSSKSLR